MNSEEVKKIKEEYENLIETKRKMKYLLERKGKLERDPKVIEYIKLIGLIKPNDANIFKIIEHMSNKKVLSMAISRVNIENSNNIYICLGTYETAYDLDFDLCKQEFIVDYDSKNAEYSRFVELETSKVVDVPIEKRNQFEEENIILLPPENMNSVEFYTITKEKFFDDALTYGNDIALKRILNMKERDHNICKNI